MISETFSPEFIRVVQGPGDKVVPPIIRSFRFDHIFYTGNTGVGRAIYQLAAEQLIPVTLELGGKSPVIVEGDADLLVTARRITLGKWLNAGQTCIAPDYMLVHKSIQTELIALIIKSIKEFYTANASGSYDYGRIINQRRFDRLMSFMKDGKLEYGGDHEAAQLYIGPTILSNVTKDAALMQEEIFGPILPVIAYDTLEEAQAIIARQPNPLAMYIFTRNTTKAENFLRNTAFGGGCINNTAYHFSNYHLPFGGVGNSGMGMYHGKYSFDLFSRAKPVMKTPLWFDPALKYPSFRGKLKLLKWIFK
jgi:aldehyde dehydrogenase (NAD+)